MFLNQVNPSRENRKECRIFKVLISSKILWLEDFDLYLQSMTVSEAYLT